MPRLLAGGFFILCGLAAASSGLYAIAADVAFFARAEAVQGRVDRMRVEVRRRAHVHVADIGFVTAAGAEMRVPAMRANSWMRHAPGDTVLVRYDPADPARARIDPLALHLLGALVALPFGTIFVAFGWALAAGPPRWPVGILVGSGAALVMLVATLVAVNEVAQAFALDRAGAVAEGEVIGHRSTTRSSAGGSAETRFAPRIRFTTEDGRVLVVEPPTPGPRAEPPPGARVTMHYRRDQPEQATPDPPRLRWLRPIAAAAVPLVFVAGGLALLVRRRRQDANRRRA